MIDDAGMASMARGGTIAMCLPATSFYLGATFAPARRMIDEFEIPVAMASDFNPGSCPSLNLQFVMNLGYLKYRMTPEEILTAVCPGMKLKVLETTEVSYRCYCSRERVKGALISLGKKELEEIAAEGETVHIGCQFCDADYQFGPEEIQNLLLEI